MLLLRWNEPKESKILEKDAPKNRPDSSFGFREITTLKLKLYIVIVYRILQ